MAMSFVCRFLLARTSTRTCFFRFFFVVEEGGGRTRWSDFYNCSTLFFLSVVRAQV